MSLALQDDLKNGAGAEYVAKSKSILIFCTVKYFQSRACARELILSVLYCKPLIAVIEPDASRGGLTHAAIVDLLVEARYLPHGQLDANATWVNKWGLKDEMRQLGFDILPTGKQIVEALFADDIIEWNRLSTFQDVSMRLIAERLLAADERGAVYVQGESSSQLLKPSALTHGRKYHLYCSLHNVGAIEVVTEMQQLLSCKRQIRVQFPGRYRSLQVSESSAELDWCDQMLLYLTAATWTSGKSSAMLAHEVCKAMRLGVPLLLVHESPSAVETEGDQLQRRACEFNDLWNEGWTPKHLLVGEANIYKQIALALKPEKWRIAGLAAVMRKMIESSGAERHPVHVDEPDPPVSASESGTFIRRKSSLRIPSTMIARALRRNLDVVNHPRSVSNSRPERNAPSSSINNLWSKKADAVHV